MKVLIIDDSETVRIAVNRILVKLGAAVIEAEDGAKGLEALMSNKDIQLIFCDVNMPVMDGMTMVSRYSENVARGSRKIPIAMLTTERHKDLVLKAKKHGVGFWVIKPPSEKSIEAIYRKVKGMKNQS
tara:strand:+ start:352 stop:735 length:384 start_codon:yes stop_codon:yes gene_type:complete